MKPSSDKPMADRSKISSASIPRNGENTAELRGSGVAHGIGPMGVADQPGTNTPTKEGYSHTVGPAYESSYTGDIGKGDGGPTIEKMGPDNPGHPL